jgi:hypothetical protein
MPGVGSRSAATEGAFGNKRSPSVRHTTLKELTNQQAQVTRIAAANLFKRFSVSCSSPL